MEDVCIVCNRAIVWSGKDIDNEHAPSSSSNAQGDASPASTSMARASSSNRSSSNPGAAAVTTSKASSTGAGVAGTKEATHITSKKHSTHHGHGAHHHHAARGHAVRVRRNHSSGKLEGAKHHHHHHHSKSGLKPLTSTGKDTAAINAAVTAAVNDINKDEADNTAIDTASDAVTRENLQDWMQIYCSEECRNEDELRSRLSFANLTEERERVLSAASHSSAGRAYSNSSLSPTFGPTASAAAFRQLVQARASNGSVPYTSSPWYNESEGSEFDWHAGHHHHKDKNAHSDVHSASRYRATSSRDGSDIIATSGSEGRRFSDASDSSRLSAHYTRSSSHGRRSSSRTRDSTDSLASLGSNGYDLYSSSTGYPVQPRPEIPHKSTSALSSGLRAMTPIHHQPPSTSASPRMTSPGRSTTAPLPSTSSSKAGLSPKTVGNAPVPTSSGTTASILIRSKSSTDPLHSESQSSSLNLTSSTYTAPSSAKTFKPASLSRSSGNGFLKPSKSSATLALSAADHVQATMAADTQDPSTVNSRRPSNATSRSHSHHGHHSHRTSLHTSTSSMPYLSCSPSSPGSGSINSARSNISTDPSTSSARGDDDDSDDGEYVPLPRKVTDEREAIPSLSNYGLFHQRTPSTPSLPSLLRESSYGRSPTGHSSFGARTSRLSSSYDANNGSTTISSVFKERQNRAAGQGGHSSALRMTPSNGVYPAASPRRATFDLNAAYTTAPVRNHSSGRLFPPHSNAHHADNTPTQSGIATRSHSFVGHYGRDLVEEPVHEVVQEVKKDEYGRTRAPSITRTDLERVSSQQSIGSSSGRSKGVETSRSSSSTLQRIPSHARPATLSPRSTLNPAVGPSPPISPTLYSNNPSHLNMYPLLHEDGVGNNRPLLATARSKSRSSFTWDHLPSYVPQYAALDLDKVRRNKSGTSLHSVYEEEGEHTAPSSQQSTVKSVQHTSSRKRLFYFPEAEEV